jgi:hypothetical protein
LKLPASFSRTASLVTFLLSPILLLVVLFAVIDWLKPVKSFVYLTGTISSEYPGSPKAGRYRFSALLENGRVVEVSQSVGDLHLVPGSKVCVAIAVRKRTEWRFTELVPMAKCQQSS